MGTEILGGAIDAGPLTSEEIDQSSLKLADRLKTTRVDVLYAHSPDYKAPLSDRGERIRSCLSWRQWEMSRALELYARNGAVFGQKRY